MSITALYKVNVVLVVKNHTTQFSFLLIYEKKNRCNTIFDS